MTAAGDRVPGPRSYALLGPVKFPWQASVDHMEHVGSQDSFQLSLDLCRNGIVCGPSSGFNLTGLYSLLRQKKADGTLSDLKNPDGEAHCVFLCCDLPYQYIAEYFDKLGDKAFPPIHNEHLTKVDLYRYDEAWELAPKVAIESFFSNQPLTPGSQAAQQQTHQLRPHEDSVVIDFRSSIDFARGSLPGAISIPLASVNGQSPFYDATLLEKTWLELDELLNAERLVQIQGRQVLMACYDGDTARVATSVLRAKGIEASSLRGGMAALLTADISTLAPLTQQPILPMTHGLSLVAPGNRSP